MHYEGGCPDGVPPWHPAVTCALNVECDGLALQVFPIREIYLSVACVLAVPEGLLW